MTSPSSSVRSIFAERVERSNGRPFPPVAFDVPVDDAGVELAKSSSATWAGWCALGLTLVIVLALVLAR